METDFMNFRDEEHFSFLDSPDFQDRSNSLLDDYYSHFSFSQHYTDDFIDTASSFWEHDEEQELNGDIAVIPVSGVIDSEIPQLSSSPDCKDDFITDWHHLAAIEHNTEKEEITSHHQHQKSSSTDKITLGKINAETAQQNQIENNLSNNCKNLLNPNNLIYDNIKQIRNINKKELITSTNETTKIFNDINNDKVSPLGIHTEIFIKSEIIQVNNQPLHDDLNLDSANDDLFGKDVDFLSDNSNNLIYDNNTIRNIKTELSCETLTQKLSNDLFIKSESDEVQLPDLNLSASDILLDTSFDKHLKNFDLITAVAKDGIDLDLSIDSDKLADLNQSDFDLKEDFDLTSYINDDTVPIPEKIIPKSAPIEIKKTPSPTKIHVKQESVDTDDDCIDVETVSPTGYRPILEAKDVTSLLEQFEANEVVNVSIIEDRSSKNVKSKKQPEVRKSSTSYSKRKALSKEDIDKKKNKVVDRIKANVRRKIPVPVIDPIPNVKANNKIIDHDKKIMQKKVKNTKLNQNEKESYHLDHDYCSIGPKQQKEGVDYYKVLRRQEINCGQGIGSKGIRCIDRTPNTTVNQNKIEDTAIRISEKQPVVKVSQQKSNSISLLKSDNRMQNSTPKSVLLKTNNSNSLLKSSNYKNVDGKLMVSVLKTNQKIKNTMNPKMAAMVETKTPHDQCIQNIIIDNDDTKLRPKKRKLNLEEYKKRREINKTRSCDNSRTNSPLNVMTATSGSSSPLINNHQSISLPVTAVGSPAYIETEMIKKEVKKLTPQELLLKMAADLLTTNPVKSTTPEQKSYTIKPFTPPGTTESSTSQRKVVVISSVKQNPRPKPCNDNIEMKTIVSIGINTDLSLITEMKTQQNSTPKIQFQIVNKKKQELYRHRAFDENASGVIPNTSGAGVSKELVQQLNLNADKKLNEIITPILQNANTSKINSNSLISNITATILQKKLINTTNNSSTDHRYGSSTSSSSSSSSSDTNVKENDQPFEHGEDKTVIILDKNRIKPKMVAIETQTEPFEIPNDTKCSKDRNKKSSNGERVMVKRQYRVRRESYSSASSVETSKSKSRKSYQPSSSSTSRSQTASVSSIASSNSSSSSRSKSRSYSRSLSRSSYSSSSYTSSRSRSRSVSRSRHRYDSTSSRNSRDKYARSRRRSPSTHSYRSYKRSRSPLKHSSDRKRSNWENMDQEKLRQVEERRVIYVGRILPGTTKNDLKRRFMQFGTVVETSVHFRDKGDNFGFVTFQYQGDAYTAIEKGNDDPNLPKYDLSFGGRRVFCQTRYSDLDNSEAIEMSCYNRNIQENSFDILLKEAQAKLRKRKV